MALNRPRGREKNVTGGGAGVHRRGDGLGTGPVGSGSVFGGSTGSGGGGGKRGPGMGLIGMLLILLLGGGGGLTGLLTGGGSAGGSLSGGTAETAAPFSAAQDSGQNTGQGSLGSLYELFGNSGGSSSGWGSSASGSFSGGSSNTGILNREVSPEAREKYTVLKGDGSDTATVMVYMCGTDLESRSGMATRDLQEMTAAQLGEKVNLLVYTGGCRQWKNQVISSSVNQIYQVKDGGLKRLVADDGTGAMTDPATLTRFLRWGAQNYPANRNILIFWDHGGGSVTGYGYDEKNGRSGSMTLSGIHTALRDAGLKYDFIGFDACLMATAENGLMLSRYADYMLASEETEPGIGWYYTNWLNMLSDNPAAGTLDLGKQLIDDFVATCDTQCRGQKTTLSLVDLAELGETVTDDFRAFSRDTAELIRGAEYKAVSTARNNSREFATSSRIDQIDLIHFAKNMGTEEGNNLADTLLSAVKYNRTSSNMTNAYGLSVYFPSSKMSYVDKAASNYEAIGMDEAYSECIRDFASLQLSGQLSSGGTTSPMQSLFGELGGALSGGSGGSSSAGGAGSSVQGGSYGGAANAEAISELLNMFLGSGVSGISGLNSDNTGFFTGRALDPEKTASYLAENRFDASQLSWSRGEDGTAQMQLSEEQWSLVHTLDLNLFYDDGEGYVDLGLDNLYAFGEDGSLIADVDGTWLSINQQPVAYYHTDTTEDGDNYSITGYVPAKLNGERVKLILIFDTENPHGYIAGAQPVYDELMETSAVARGLTELQPGDTLDFICDFYSYDGTYQDSYLLGEPMTVTENMQISNTVLGEGKVKAFYRFTDIYQQHYWTPEVPTE